MGTPAFSVPALRALAASDHDVVAVFSQPPRPAGRGKKDRPSPVHETADSLGIRVETPETLKAPAVQGLFASFRPDVAVVVAYGLILPQVVLDTPARGCLNIHASLLPRWRGAAPIHRAIMAGDAETGISIMQMEAGLDTGPVLRSEREAIRPNDTTGDLHDRLSDLGARLILETLDRLDALSPKPQADEGVSYAEKVDKAEARIDWTRPAEEIDRQIRGLSPFPGAWTTANGRRLKLLRSNVATGTGGAGTVQSGLTIACGSGAVEITELQAEGRGRQSADAFLRGTPLPPGTVLGE